MIVRDCMSRKSKAILDIPLKPDLSFEQSLWNAGLAYVAGLDEAGRGAWAGPVFAAAVILPANQEIATLLEGVRDSKQMSAHYREHWAEVIKKHTLAWSIGTAQHNEIDEIGILPATRLAMQRALDAISIHPQHLLIDAVKLPNNTYAQTSLIKGDRRCLSIAAASVLAKTARDDLMRWQAQQYPQYGFHKHKGYGTRYHQQTLAEHGACPIHRMSFRPLRVCSTLIIFDEE